MRLRFLTPILILTVALGACVGSPSGLSDREPAHHTKTGRSPSIGGAVLDADAPISVNVTRVPILTTFVKAMRATGAEATLAGTGPVTLFAPTNDAFGRLAPGTVDALLKPANKASLVKLFNYWIVAGRITTNALRQRIAAGGGTATIRSIGGAPLTVSLTGDVVTLTDVNGNKSYIQTGDVPQANGMIQVVNGVLIPDLE